MASNSTVDVTQAAELSRLERRSGTSDHARVVHVTTPSDRRLRPHNGTAPPRRVANCTVRTREYLTPDEINRLTNAARSTGRHGHRDGR
jgi:hypothetical protein